MIQPFLFPWGNDQLGEEPGGEDLLAAEVWEAGTRGWVGIPKLLGSPRSFFKPGAGTLIAEVHSSAGVWAEKC